jgi:peptide chain release factor 1
LAAPPFARLFERLKEAAERYRALEASLADPALHAQPGALAAALREMGALRERAESHERWVALTRRRAEAAELAADTDAAVAQMAREELAEIDAEIAAVEETLRLSVLDDEPNRGRNVILEIRAGTGGDEASLFVGDLARLYSRWAESRKLKVEWLSSSPTEVGGFKELVLGVSGAAAWDSFRFEAGGHRVQRVPETETQGRIHTSAATVAVLPEAEEVEFELKDSDLRIDTFRSSGPGGQSVNKTSSAIRITHIPTNTVVQCQDEKSQHKNKSRALRMLRARLKDAQDSARKSELDQARRTQIGSGDRSERIRTYNFPQNRVTDHRIKESYNLQSVVLGELEKVVGDLRKHDLEQKLAALGGEGA